jgi:uncharacterized protein (TIRG00374 family)
MKKLATPLKLFFTAGILYFLYVKGLLDISRVHGVVLQPFVFVSALGLLLLAQVFGILRWWWLLKGQGFDLAIWDCARLTMIGTFFNTAIPGAVSGDLVKGYYIVKRQPNGRGKTKALATLLLDRILGLGGLITISFAALILNFDTVYSNASLHPLAVIITPLFLGLLFFYFVVLVRFEIPQAVFTFINRLPGGNHITKLFESLKVYQNCRGYFLRGVGLSLVIHCMVVSIIVLMARQLGGFELVPFNQFCFLVPFGMLVTAIPVAPAGMGTGHAAFLGLFRLVGAQGGADLFMAFVSFQIMVSLIGGIFYIRHKQETDALDHEAQTQEAVGDPIVS